MTSLPRRLRERLAATLTRSSGRASAWSSDPSDGTRKWLLRFADGNDAETVFIPEEDRGALCLSSQVGCTLTCTFCHTGTQRLVRNLTAGEIVGQVLVAARFLRRVADAARRAAALQRRADGHGRAAVQLRQRRERAPDRHGSGGIAISRRRITLSTSGVVPMIRRVGAELGVKLAVSLHAATDELRDVLVPINRKYPIAELMRACREYPGADNARRITFEYVMLKGVNDAPADAKALARLVAGIPAKFNLIPFNAWPGAPFECSSDGDDAADSRTFSTTPATPRRSARRAAATSSPPAASSDRRANASAAS